MTVAAPLAPPVAFIAHAFAAGALATSALMVATAGELGPMGPLVIAQAFYLATFALTVEGALLARVVVAAARRAVQRRRAVRPRQVA